MTGDNSHAGEHVLQLARFSIFEVSGRWYWSAINGLPQGAPQGPFGISREAYQAAVQKYDEYFGTRGKLRIGH
jgi:hypothetical protein